MLDKQENSIYVTKPSVPDLDKYVLLLSKIWKSHQLTNNGDCHEKSKPA